MSEIEPRRPGQAVTLQNRAESEKKVDKALRKQQITEILFRHPDGLTAEEVGEILYATGCSARIGRNAAAPRLTEMTNDGCVEVIGTKKCLITGSKVAVYRLVSEIPR